jgi:hypothetical protein
MKYLAAYWERHAKNCRRLGTTVDRFSSLARINNVDELAELAIQFETLMEEFRLSGSAKHRRYIYKEARKVLRQVEQLIRKAQREADRMRVRLEAPKVYSNRDT